MPGDGGQGMWDALWAKGEHLDFTGGLLGIK
jgi:hypothetical protein